MRIGYARTSTVDQQAGLDAQLAELERLGCTKLFHERVSSVAERAQLEAALDYLRDNDTLVVTKLDRLAGQYRTCSPSLNGSAPSRRRSRSAISAPSTIPPPAN